VETWSALIVRPGPVNRQRATENGRWSFVVVVSKTPLRTAEESDLPTRAEAGCERRTTNDQRRSQGKSRPFTALLVLNFLLTNSVIIMLFSKEYVGYLAREVSKKLVASGLIETKAMPALNEKVHAALLEELALEDRINDEVRVILEAYSDELQKSGANYQEMFRKVKTELVKKYKAVL
jgi:hypothetical protein